MKKLVATLLLISNFTFADCKPAYEEKVKLRTEKLVNYSKNNNVRMGIGIAGGLAAVVGGVVSMGYAMIADPIAQWIFLGSFGTGVSSIGISEGAHALGRGIKEVKLADPLLTLSLIQDSEGNYDPTQTVKFADEHGLSKAAKKLTAPLEFVHQNYLEKLNIEQIKERVVKLNASDEFCMKKPVSFKKAIRLIKNTQ